MNKVILQGRVVGTTIKRHKNVCYDYSGSLVTFVVDTEEECINHKTGVCYQRTDRHSVAVWGPLADNVFEKLQHGSQVQIEGAVRVKRSTVHAGGVFWNIKPNSYHRSYLHQS